MSDDKAQVIKVPNMLRAKVGNKPGVSPDTIVQQAEASLSGMQEEYESWIRDYLKTINKALAEARRGSTPNMDAIARIRRTSHEIKGQGQTFGYPLLTRVGHMLHGFIERDEAVAARHLDLIAAHVDFMNLVVQESLRGDGGAKEDELLAALEAAAQKLAKP